MKLLLYSEYFAPRTGGVETIVMELARGLSERSAGGPGEERFEITVVTRTPADAGEDARLPFRVVRLPGFWELVRLIRGADLVHAAGPAMAPLALSFFLRTPLVVEHHGFQVACPNGQMFYEPEQSLCPGHYMAGRYGKCVQCNAKVIGFWKSLRLLVLVPVRRSLANRARANITPTEWLAAGLKLKRTEVIPHGIPAASETNSEDATTPAFAYVGRLVTTKGVPLLLEATERLCKEGCKFRLKIIGDGPERKSLESRAAALNGTVEFLGDVTRERQGAVLGGVAAVVMPSVSEEAFGLAAAENMLKGKLLIVSNVGSLREVVGDTALVFRSGDAGALAACMRRALENPSLASSLGSAARGRARQLFSLDSMIQGHVSVYWEALPR